MIVGTKFFWANPQKYQTLVPAKNSHLKVNDLLRRLCDPLAKFVTIHKAARERYCAQLSTWPPWPRPWLVKVATGGRGFLPGSPSP